MTFNFSFEVLDSKNLEKPKTTKLAKNVPITDPVKTSDPESKKSKYLAI